LFVSSTASSALGFLFWLVVAHRSETRVVGLATSAYAAGSMVALLGLAGFDGVFISRLARDRDQSQLFASGLTVSGLASAGLATGFLVLMPEIAPRLQQSISDPALRAVFVVNTVLMTWNSLSNAALIALKGSAFILYANLGGGLVRLAMPFVFPHAGFADLLLFLTLSQVINVAIGFWALAQRFGLRLRLSLSQRVVREVGRFGFGLYVSGVLNLGPDTVLPLLVLGVLGPEASAHFYICFTLANAFYQLVFSSALSLIADMAADPDKSRAKLRHGIRVSFSLIIPGVAIGCVVAPFVLDLFGTQYGRASLTLQLLLVSAVPLTAFSMYGAYFRQAPYLSGLIGSLLVNAVAILGLAFWLTPSLGLDGVAVAWLGGYLIAVIAAALATRLKRRRGIVLLPVPGEAR
jgi:O-antigen/teichoic acid export membrane protein